MPQGHQTGMSELLAEQRERSLTPIEQSRLDELLTAYRRGLVRKAEALRLPWHVDCGRRCRDMDAPTLLLSLSSASGSRHRTVVATASARSAW